MATDRESSDLHHLHGVYGKLFLVEIAECKWRNIDKDEECCLHI